jgi:hypothetical protein
MNNTLLSNNNFFDYTILIGCGVILSCTLFYLIRSNYTAIPSKNKEALTNQEIEAINNENTLTKINNQNIDAIIDNDSDFDTDVDSQSTSDYGNLIDSASSSDFEDIVEEEELFFLPRSVTEGTDRGEFIMPDVDFNVCPIEELKLFEISSLYAKELAEYSISEETLMEMIS